MRNRSAFSLRLVVASSMIAASGVAAQNTANVSVTVYPQATSAQPVTTRAGFLVCLGTAADVDQYGKELTPTSGVANQNFRNLPVGATVRVTVSKLGYIGAQLSRTLLADWNNHLQVTLFPGSGGPSCETTATSPQPAPAPPPVKLDAQVWYQVPPAPPAPAPAPPPAPRLGEQVLTYRGIVLDGSAYTTLDCRSFGRNFVMTGISGRSGQAVDQLKIRCTQVTSSGAVGSGTSAVVRTTSKWGGDDDGAGTAFTRYCPAGQAVVGIRGTLVEKQVRSLGLYCRPLAGGLATGTTNSLALVGGTTGTSWGPDHCGQGRPARAIKAGVDVFREPIPLALLFAPWIVGGVQLICEQPAQ